MAIWTPNFPYIIHPYPDKTKLSNVHKSFWHWPERERERLSLSAFLGGHQGPYSPYKPCNHNLYIGIVIFPHIDNPQTTVHIIDRRKKQLKLEQLERLHSENTPHRPMITHTIDSYQIPSQNIWKECKQNCGFFFKVKTENFLKNWNFRILL